MQGDEAGRTLLEGVVALRLGLVEVGPLVEALDHWALGEGQPLRALLAERAGPAGNPPGLLSGAVDDLLRSHGGNALACLRDLDHSGHEWEGLRLVEDPGVRRALGFDVRDGAGHDEGPTAPAGDWGTMAEGGATLGVAEGTMAVAIEVPAEDSGTPGGDAWATRAFTIAGASAAVGPSPSRFEPSATRAEPPAIGAPDPFETQAATGSPTAGPPIPQTLADRFATRAEYDGGSETAHFSASGLPSGAPGGRGNPSANRFHILRSHAKGGLGEVFVARDLELNREVALKEIQGRHADHAESRLRFLVEAEVTGGLEHPGIVPVYGLGHYPDGRPFYAMRFIRGESLQEAIVRFHQADAADRDPGARELELRQLLGRFLDVCNAMAYAHSRGVLHRDLKPANIMLGAFGETLVVDWGLAKFQDQPESEALGEAGAADRPLRPMSAGSSSATVFGSAIGTPQYMSPEQAAGQLDAIGPASDVYSLGGTLYTLLVGKAAFQDRNLLQLLEKVRRGDFPAPRAVNPAVPRALEAVCLKAMANPPEGRYPSAAALADDIEHWLADEPVSAYRDPLAVRLSRWAKRHKTPVIAAAAVLLASVAGLSAFSVLIERERARTEANFRLARSSVEEMLTELGEFELADVPQMEPVRAKMLRKAAVFYDKFLAEHGEDRSIRGEAGRAYTRSGDIRAMLGDYREAGTSYGRAVGLLAPLAGRGPESRRDLARVRHGLGVLLKKSNRFAGAERSLREALRLRTELAAGPFADDDDRRDAQESLYQLGALLARMPGRQREVEESYRRAVAERRALVAKGGGQPGDLRKLARYLDNWGILLKKADPPAARSKFEEALDVLKPLAAGAPSVPGYQWDLARSTNHLATMFEDDREPEKAAAEYEVALRLLKALHDAFPTIADYRHEMAAVHANLSKALMKLGRADDAEGHAIRALDIESVLADGFPGRPDFRQYLAVMYLRRAILQERRGDHADAEETFRKAESALARLVAAFPEAPEYLGDLGMARENLAFLLAGQRRWAEARPPLVEAIANVGEALKAGGDNLEYRKFLWKRPRPAGRGAGATQRRPGRRRRRVEAPGPRARRPGVVPAGRPFPRETRGRGGPVQAGVPPLRGGRRAGPPPGDRRGEGRPRGAGQPRLCLDPRAGGLP